MSRPGVEVYTRAAPPSRANRSNTGTWFVAGVAERGPTAVPQVIFNMAEYVAYFGNRVSYGLLYDALDEFFREGGTVAQVLRVVGPAATKDSVTLNDSGASPSIAVDSLGEGASGLSVAVAAGIATFTVQLSVVLAGVEVERSPDLADPASAANWSLKSKYVRVRALGANLPTIVVATALTGGNDQRASVTDTERSASLNKIHKRLGPGQISYPGATTTTMYVALLNHAMSFNRIALLDGPDTSSDTSLTGTADGVRANSSLQKIDVSSAAEYGAMFWSWQVVPGVVQGTTRTIPPCAVAAGLIARSDSVNGNPNMPAAADNGVSNYVIQPTQIAFTGAIRQSVNSAGVCVLIALDNTVRLYGYRTLALNSAWTSLASARLRMAIMDRAGQIGEAFLFDQVDGKGKKLAEFGGALAGMLMEFYALDALYGESAQDAFAVDVGPTVNTPDTIAAQELHAKVGIRTSPMAELVYIEITKVSTTEVLV